MRWATRSGCHVEWCACASLIRRFIDSDGEFVFVDDVADVLVTTAPMFDGLTSTGAERYSSGTIRR